MDIYTFHSLPITQKWEERGSSTALTAHIQHSKKKWFYRLIYIFQRKLDFINRVIFILSNRVKYKNQISFLKDVS